MNREMVRAIEQLAKERDIEPGTLLERIEVALLAAYNQAHPYLIGDKVHIDTRTGDTILYVEGEQYDVDFSEGDLGRIAAASVKKAINTYLQSEHAIQTLDRYEDMIGHVIEGRVEFSDRRATLVSLGDAEARVPNSERNHRERLRKGARHAFVVLGISARVGGDAEVILSRTDPRLLEGILALNVPEIEQGLIQIVQTARKPGEQSLIVLQSDEVAVLPSVRGIGNNRLRAIRTELGQERLHIVVWRDNTQEYLRALFAGVRISELEYEESTDGHINHLVVRAGEDQIEAAKAIAPLVEEILGTDIEIQGLVQSHKDRSRPVNERMRQNTCQHILNNGRQCPNQKEVDSEYCSLHGAQHV